MKSGYYKVRAVEHGDLYLSSLEEGEDPEKGYLVCLVPGHPIFTDLNPGHTVEMVTDQNLVISLKAVPKATVTNIGSRT